MHGTSRLYTDDLEHDRRLVCAPKEDVRVKVDLDVEGPFLFTDRLCTKLYMFVMVCMTVESMQVLVPWRNQRQTSFWHPPSRAGIVMVLSVCVHTMR
jgi:hypothetical protein